METQLSDGDLVLVDTNLDSQLANGVFVLSTDAGLKIKRLNRKMDGSIEVISDNKTKYPPEQYSAEDAAKFFRVVAKVVVKLYDRIH